MEFGLEAGVGLAGALAGILALGLAVRADRMLRYIINVIEKEKKI